MDAGVKTQIKAAGFFIAGFNINRRATHEYEQAAGIFALGFLIFTLLLKVAVPVLLGELRQTRHDDVEFAGTVNPVSSL